MDRKWEKENLPYIESFANPNRPKYGRKFDRYYRGRFKVGGQIHVVSFGWMSAGWTAKKCYEKVCRYKENIKSGKKPTNWKEEQEVSQKEAQLEEERNITFDSYWNNHYYLDAKATKKECTYIPEKRHFQQWLSPAFGEKPLISITSDDLTDLRNDLIDKGKAPRTIQYVFSTFRLVWNHAKRRGIVGSDSPTKAVSLGKINNERVRFLSINEVQDLLAQLRDENIDAYDFAVTALNTGARRSELLQLTWKNVDLKGRELRLIHTKTSEPRTIPITDELYELLSRRQNESETEYVFSKDDQPWKDVPNALRRVLNDLFNEGVDDPREKVVLHSLRHTAASHLLRAGVDVRTIQTLFGWSTVQMLQRYTHVMDDAKIQAITSLNQAYNKQEKAGKVLTFEKVVNEELPGE